MVFGIDLGTTNSIIGRDEMLCTGLVASNVNLKTKEQVSRDVYGEDVIGSYKINMGLGESGQVPIFCSSVILKKLANIASERNEVKVKDVVISVPAYFATTQREAVKKAAEDAGLNLLRVINEPTAAAIYVCRDIKGLVLVFDLGGGTFDVTLIDTRDGFYRTIATDGEILGGDDLDNEIVKYIIKKYHILMMHLTKENKSRLRSTVRLIKEKIQKQRADQTFDLSYLGSTENAVLTVDEYKKMVQDVFSPAISKTLTLLDNYVSSYEKPQIIYTGGSTYCPYLMELLYEEIPCEELTYGVPKDMLVAHGIAYIAKLVEDGEDERLITNVTKQLSVELDDGLAFPIIEDNTIVPCTVRYPFFNSRDGKTMSIRLYQGSRIYANENDYIGQLDYEFDEEKAAGTGLINVDVSVTYDGFVMLKVFNQDEDETMAKSIKLKIM